MGQSENIQLAQMSSGAVLQQAISAAAEIGIADRIDRGGVRPVSELASELGCDERSLYRCLRFLASHGVFEEKTEGSFALNPLAEALRSDAEDSFRAGARLFGICQRAISEIEYSVRTGKSGFGKAYGAEIFPYLKANAELAPVFDAGMSAVHGSETPAMLEAFDLKCWRTLEEATARCWRPCCSATRNSRESYTTRGTWWNAPETTSRRRGSPIAVK